MSRRSNFPQKCYAENWIFDQITLFMLQYTCKSFHYTMSYVKKIQFSAKMLCGKLDFRSNHVFYA